MNSEFSFSLIDCQTKRKERSLSNYLPITAERIIEVILLQRVLVLFEMQRASSRIWTHVTVSIFCHDNHYMTVHPPKRSLLKNNNLTHTWRDKEFHTPPEAMSPKVNIIAQLEFKLVYFEPAVQHFSHVWRYEALYTGCYWLNSMIAVKRIALVLNNTWRLICH